MFSKFLYHANQHKVDVHDDVLLQDQEKIKECDKVLCVAPVQVISSSPSVSESISNDGNITVSEGESLSCSKMLPQAGACATPISPVISAAAGFSPVCAAADARAPGAAMLGAAAADCAPAAAGFSPHFAAAATVNSACAPATTGFFYPILLPLRVLLPRRFYLVVLLLQLVLLPRRVSRPILLPWQQRALLLYPLL
jgi:hypothetical protein